MTTAALHKSFWMITRRSVREAFRLYFEPILSIRNWFIRYTLRHSEADDIAALTQSIEELKTQVQASAWSVEAVRLEHQEASESIRRSLSTLQLDLIRAVNESIDARVEKYLAHRKFEDELRMPENRSRWLGEEQLNLIVSDLMIAVDKVRLEQERLNDEMAKMHQAFVGGRSLAVESNPLLQTTLKKALESALVDFAEKVRKALSNQKELTSTQAFPMLLGSTYRNFELPGYLTEPQQFFGYQPFSRAHDWFNATIALSTRANELPGIIRSDPTEFAPFRSIRDIDMDLLVSQALARAFAEVAKKSTK